MLYNDHWLGNEVIHRLTNQGHYTLRIDMQDWERNKVWVEYSFFLVEDEQQGYKLHVAGFSGDAAGDSLSQHHLANFHTSEADYLKGTWWHHSDPSILQSNLNGKYYKGGLIDRYQYDGIIWNTWKGDTYSLKRVEMKIKRVT